MKCIPIYIIHPFRGTGAPGSYEANYHAVKAVCERIVREEPDKLPLSPILLFPYLRDQVAGDREKAMELCYELMKLVIRDDGEIRAYGDYENSEGCMSEIEFAGDWGVEVHDGRSLVTVEVRGGFLD